MYQTGIINLIGYNKNNLDKKIKIFREKYENQIKENERSDIDPHRTRRNPNRKCMLGTVLPGARHPA